MDVVDLQDLERDATDHTLSPDLMVASRNLLDLQTGMGMLPIANGREALIGNEDDGVWPTRRKTLSSTLADARLQFAVMTDL
ncbi:hypothetical protein ACLOJK_004168 [Asimina triloba]